MDVNISPTSSGYYAVRFKYDPYLIEIIKDTVPARSRRWDPANRCWLVSADQIRNLISHLSSHDYEVGFEVDA